MPGQRNRYGVIDQTNSIRTVDGVAFMSWMSFPSAERLAAYRKAGIRCRRFKEELYINPADKALALAIDTANDPDF